MTKKYQSFYIVGFPTITVTGAVVLDSFQSNGNGKARLAEVKKEQAGKFNAIYLMKAVA